jgi:NADPH:quinone reductase-like Zn-dependent oxidoreductase
VRAFAVEESFGLENLKITDRPDPKPGPGEVLVRMKAVSLNYRDFLMVTGKYNPKQKLPLIPLSDGAGEIQAVGEGVTRWKVGDRVMGIFAQSWLYGAPTRDTLKTTLGGPLDGTLSELRVFSELGVVATPDHLSHREAATLPCAGLTAYSALFPFGGIGPGDTVVVLGTGGVSLFSLQFAKLLGARVILTSSDDEKLSKGKDLGADEIINYRKKENWEREVLKMTSMKGADLIIEVGGAGTLPKSIAATRPWGTVSLIGVLAGGESTMSLFPVLMQGIRIQGVIVGNRQDFENMNRVVTAHKLKPVVSEVFPFEKARDALAHLRDGKHFGKVCIDIS